MYFQQVIAFVGTYIPVLFQLLLRGLRLRDASEDKIVRIRRLERQLEEEKKHGTNLQESLNGAEATLHATTTALRQTKDELVTSRNAQHDLQARADALLRSQKELKAVQAQLLGDNKVGKETLQDAERKMSKMARRLGELGEVQRELESTQRDLREKTQELGRLNKVHVNTESLLETRTRELRDAQAYLNKADNISHADVQRKVARLNSLILQLSAQLAYGANFDQDRPYNDKLEVSYQNIADVLGQGSAKLLYRTPHMDDPSWVQVGLQALLSNVASEVAMAWDAKLDKVEGALLSSIHDILFEREPRAISARWKGLVVRSLRQMREGEDVMGPVTERILAGIVDVLRISGARDIENSDAIASSYRDKVREVVSESMEIQKSTGEEVSSSDFDIICPSFDTPFVPEFMDDMDDCRRRSVQRVIEDRWVLCPTELGLRRREKMSLAEGAEKIVTVVLMKAKVALRGLSQPEEMA